MARALNSAAAYSRAARQRGFALITALFLLVAIAVLAGFAVSLSSTWSQGQATDISRMRAHQAALAGIEWASYRLQTENSPWQGCRAGIELEVGGSLASFSPVTVDCEASAYREGATTSWLYTVTAVAKTHGIAGVEQTVQVSLVR